MKFVFLFALIFSSSVTFAKSLPRGKLKISIVRSEWIKQGDTYTYRQTPLCTEVIPFQTINQPAPPFKLETSDTCKLTYKGNSYTANAIYGVFYKKDPELGMVLDFVSSIQVSRNAQGESIPFPMLNFGNASTRDLNVKNMIVRSEAGTECANGETGCLFDTSIVGTFDFEVQ